MDGDERSELQIANKRLFDRMAHNMYGPLNEQDWKEKMTKNGSEIRLNHALEELAR